MMFAGRIGTTRYCAFVVCAFLLTKALTVIA